MKKRKISLLLKLLLPLLLLIIIEISLLAGAIFGGGLIGYMENNELEILRERVINRKNYLEREMLTRWSDLDGIVIEVNSITKKLLQSGEISLDTLDQGSQYCSSLLNAVDEKLVDMMRMNKVTGAFIVLNTHDLQDSAEKGIYQDKPGIYIRDYDPVTNSSQKNQDLLLEYGPADVVQSLSITLDSGWKPLFDFKNSDGYGAYLYEPYQAARNAVDIQDMETSDFGYWSEPYCLYENDLEIISYSVPLILSDGSVYGVLGVDVSLNYLKTLLPAEEIQEKDTGSYLLGIDKDDNYRLTDVLISGKSYVKENQAQNITELYMEDGKLLVKNDHDQKINCAIEYFQLYNANTPFSGQRWALVGIVNSNDLFAFSNNVIMALVRATLYTLAAGIIGGFFISFFISHPITALTENVRKATPSRHMALQRTGIREIDLLSEALEQSNEEALYAAEKFSYIINTVSLQISVFEVNREEKTVFVTGRFFKMLELPETDSSHLTADEFWGIIDSLNKYRQTSGFSNEVEALYKIPVSGENACPYRYIRITLNENGNHCIGLVEDVTDTVMEKETIEYERDHDLLTGLLNRRAFNRIMEEMFAQGQEVLKTAALIMIDLDGLKHVNDTYGHKFGDKYIQNAAQCFKQFTPDGTLVSRQSGDEFQIFFYGYDDEEEIRDKIRELRNGIRETMLVLPDETSLCIQMSGGVAWYPKDSKIYDQLRIYSDNAMYRIKHGSKNQFAEFDKNMDMS